MAKLTSNNRYLSDSAVATGLQRAIDKMKDYQNRGGQDWARGERMRTERILLYHYNLEPDALPVFWDYITQGHNAMDALHMAAWPEERRGISWEISHHTGT